MTEQEAIRYIHSFQRFSARPTLERIRRLLALLGNPQERLRVVHVAGTNGKGSVCAMTAAALAQAGYRTGLFLSPYVLEFRERMQLDGRMIPPEELAEQVERVRPLAQQVEDLNEFELITAMGYDWFCRKGCDVAVIETGLGGAFDATNAVAHPLVSVITSIGLDHTAVLGDTVEQIARAKAGIIKPGAPVVCAPGQPDGAFAVLLEAAAQAGVPVLTPSLAAAEDPAFSLEGTRFHYDGQALFIGMPGRYQLANALTAYTALDCLRTRRGFDRLTPEAVARGLAQARLPARMEVLQREPLVLLDGAHNPPGAQALAQALSLVGDRPVTAVMGVLADKDSGGVLEQLAPHLRRVITVTPDSPRALPAHELAARAGALGLDASAAHGGREALDLAVAVAAREGGAVLICGSLYLAAQLRRLFLQPEA